MSTTIAPEVARDDTLDELREKLQWALAIRRDPNRPTIAYQLADELIKALKERIIIRKEQLDRFGP